jgi:RNA polymerase sigma factor (sigma-70 family)
LWRRFGAGDGSAFAQLYRDHHHDVFKYCRSLLHDEEDAHDAAQGAWTALWTAPGAARREIPLRPWLFRVAHNEAISILRRRRRHGELTDLEVPALDDVASHFELRDRLATLRVDLASLPERQRGALLLREVAGLGHAEIADVFGITLAAAKQSIHEARRALLEAEGGRSMACDLVQRAISDGDGRVRRGRRLRAHLRDCATCRTFADAGSPRRRDLRLLFPLRPPSACWRARRRARAAPAP